MIPLQKTIEIQTLLPRPGITIWTAKITDVLSATLAKDRQPQPEPLKQIMFLENSFTRQLLIPSEINTLNGFKAFKKQKEWLGGRLLMKMMVQHFFLPDTPLDHITLDYHEQGAPYITCDPSIGISLSHSHNYTAAACTVNPHQTIGIDIEKIADKPDVNFLKTAFTHKEIAHMPDDAQSIFRNWTIKEAYLKFIKKGFHEPLHQVEVIDGNIWHRRQLIDVSVYSTTVGCHHVLSLVSDKSFP